MTKSTETGPLAGRITLVTGAARGIGAAIAARLVADGAYVYAGDIIEPEGRDLEATLDGACTFARLDITDEDEWAVRGLTRSTAGCLPDA